MRKAVVAAVAFGAVAATMPARAAIEPIQVCAHVPITGNAPLARHPDRFGQVYLDAVNAEQGGIDGRPVRLVAYDDQSSATGARAALERCRRDGADLYVGFSGPDATAAVMRLADELALPYLTTTHVDAWGLPEACCASLGVSLERVAETFARSVLEQVPDARIGVVRAVSPFWDPVADAFSEIVGERIVVDRSVQRDEPAFTELWTDFRAERVDLVATFVPAGVLGSVLRQQPAGYEPHLVATGLDWGRGFAAAQAHSGGPITVLADGAPAWQPPEEADRSRLPWQDLIAEHHRVFATYSQEQSPGIDDDDWIAFIRTRQIARLLDSLDGDLSRRRILAALNDYEETADVAYPSCALALERGAAGTTGFQVMSVVDQRLTHRIACGGEIRIDLAPPELACESELLTGRLSCWASDTHAGIDRIEVTTTAGLPDGFTERSQGFCAATFTDDWQLPPGVRLISVRAIDCTGREVRADLVVSRAP